MKRIQLVTTIFLTLIICTTTVSVITCTKESTPSVQITEVTAEEASDLIQDNRNNPDFIIIDVRTPAEYADGHIENARNIDFNASDFEDEIKKLDRTKKYLVYCRSGNRSRGAINLMDELQFQDVYHMYQGIIGWENGVYPTVK